MSRAKGDAWKLTFKLLPHFDDLKLVHISDVTHVYPRHVHEEFCIAIILRGRETHVCRGEDHVAVAGDLLLINAEEAHESRSVDVEYKTVQINPRTFTRLFEIERPFFIQPVITDPELFQSFLNLYSLLAQDRPLLEQESEFVSTVGSLLERDEAGSNISDEPRAVRRVRDYLRSHYSESIALSNLASIANLSPFHLIRIFSDRVGVPPHEFQTQVRITNAQRLLRNGRSISEAAMETGFFDQSHFSRNFKRITGLTPRTYLRHSNIVQDS